MSFPLNLDSVSHGIQLAVAPVFLLTAVSGMIGVVANRLARIIDRARLLEDRMRGERADADQEVDWQELIGLRRRGLLANASIALLTLCAFMIGLTIMVLFLGETIELQFLRISVVGFLTGVVCFLAAVGCFMVETLLATRLLNFGKIAKLRKH